jgi:peptide/nickel transport system permease protein
MSGTGSPNTSSTAVRLALAAFAVVSVLALLAPLAPLLSPDLRAGQPLSPSLEGILLGTDEVGRDLLSRLLAGFTKLWLPSVSVVAAAAAAGSVIGAVAGIAPGWLGRIAHAPINLFRALPPPVMALAAVAVYGPGLSTLTIALCVASWPWYARLVRGEIRLARQSGYAEAVRLTAPRRMFYLLPFAFPRLIVVATYDIGNTILMLALLSYLGLGDPVPAAELGNITHSGLTYLREFPRVAALPIAGVAGLVLMANIAGAAFRRRYIRT